MAIRSKSLFLYGLQITPLNSSIDFVNVSLGSTIQATLNLGFYSLSSLLVEIERAMNVADPDNVYTAVADRTILGGLENRVSISTNGAFLSLLFGSGPRVASSVAPYIGFNSLDYTGNTTYTGSATAGISLVTALTGYNYLGPEFYRKVLGNVNVSPSGQKEAIVFAIQMFVNVQFMYEPQQKIIDEWKPLIDWMIQQRLFDFTPEYDNPTVFYTCTLETSSADGQGLAFMPTEMLPEFPFLYDMGQMMFRVIPS